MIVTEWYTNPQNPTERAKVSVAILDRDLRADALRVLASRQTLQKADLSMSYADQVLKLHAIRKIKHSRFQFAVLGLALYLLAVLVYGASLLVAAMFVHPA